LILARSLRISKYNHTSVTIRPKAAYHSIYFGAPFSEASSIKSKSRTRFREAITTIKSVIKMLVIEPSVGLKNGISNPNKRPIKPII
jgi:3-polyprenyl-4-hydroxybenzoate decarboxylase